MKRPVILAVICVFAIGFGLTLWKDARKGDSPATVTSPSPTVSSALVSSPETQQCTFSELEPRIEFEGAAGSTYSTFTIKNISARSCDVVGENHPQLDYGPKETSIKIELAEATTQKTYTLAAGQSLTSIMRSPNGPQCSTGISPVFVTYTYSLPKNQKLTFQNVDGEQKFIITACAAPKDITKIDLKSWELKNE